MVNRLEEFMGRGRTRALAADFILKKGQERVQAFTPDMDDHNITLPDTAVLRLGGPQFYVVNLSASFFFNVLSHNGFQTYQVDPEKVLVLTSFSTVGNERWIAQSRDFVGIAEGELTP